MSFFDRFWGFRRTKSLSICWRFWLLDDVEFSEIYQILFKKKHPILTAQVTVSTGRFPGDDDFEFAICDYHPINIGYIGDYQAVLSNILLITNYSILYKLYTIYISILYHIIIYKLQRFISIWVSYTCGQNRQAPCSLTWQNWMMFFNKKDRVPQKKWSSTQKNSCFFLMVLLC